MKWIWNEDGSALINLNDVRRFEIGMKSNGEWIIVAILTYGTDIIGYYDSKDFAIKVLKEITEQEDLKS